VGAGGFTLHIFAQLTMFAVPRREAAGTERRLKSDVKNHVDRTTIQDGKHHVKSKKSAACGTHFSIECKEAPLEVTRCIVAAVVILLAASSFWIIFEKESALLVASSSLIMLEDVISFTSRNSTSVQTRTIDDEDAELWYYKYKDDLSFCQIPGQNVILDRSKTKSSVRPFSINAGTFKRQHGNDCDTLEATLGAIKNGHRT
jgi:hypothetical protein